MFQHELLMKCICLDRHLKFYFITDIVFCSRTNPLLYFKDSCMYNSELYNGSTNILIFIGNHNTKNVA